MVKSCLSKTPKNLNRLVFGRKLGVGEEFDLNKDFITLMHYPVTTEFGQNFKNMCKILDAIKKLTFQN